MGNVVGYPVRNAAQRGDVYLRTTEEQLTAADTGTTYTRIITQDEGILLTDYKLTLSGITGEGLYDVSVRLYNSLSLKNTVSIIDPGTQVIGVSMCSDTSQPNKLAIGQLFTDVDALVTGVPDLLLASLKGGINVAANRYDQVELSAGVLDVDKAEIWIAPNSDILVETVTTVTDTISATLLTIAVSVQASENLEHSEA